MASEATVTAGSSAMPREPANVVLRLRQLELHGSGPRARSLKALPARFVQGIDTDQGVRLSLARPGMGSLLRELELLVVRADSAWIQNRRAMTQIRTLMSTLCARISESVQQRAVFVSCQGDVLVVHLLHTLAASEGGPPTDMAVTIINECVQLTAELAIADLQAAEAFATQRPLVAALFTLMGDRRTVDAALTLAQELLSVGADVFPLSAVPNFSALIRGLSPRGLSLMGRALAVLLAKTAEQNMDGVPAPECMPPELCASCANNAVLLALPQLLERIVRLLQTESPPAGLWDHMLSASQLPSVLLAGWPGDELGWDQLGAMPRVITIVLPQHALPPLAAGGAAQFEAELQAAMAAHVGATLPGLGLPGFQIHTGPNGETHGSLHLASLQSSLWSTLQADLLYVLWALMGGKTKQEAQRQAVGLGLLPVVRAMLDRLDWKARATHHHGQHGAGCSCSPQSCLQMQLLRTLQAICEKESDAVSYHWLLLLTDETEPTLDGLVGGVAGGPDAARPVTDVGDDEPDAGGDSSREIWSSEELARTERRDSHARGVDGVPAAGGSARGSSSAGAGPSSPPLPQQQSRLARAAALMPTPERAAPGSVLHRLLTLLLEQSSTSAYLLGLASCIHKWVQASAAHEQLLVAAHPGLLDFLLDQILTPEPPPEPQLQVFFDLLAELIKFNPVLLDRVQTELASPGGASSGAPPRPARAALFLERLLDYTVDASIFVQGVALTLAPHASPLRGARALAALNLAPPDPCCAAAAGMPPAPARSGSLARADGPLGRAARGCIAEFLQTRRVRLARSLMSAVQVADVSVETMCVINAAIIFFLLAELEGQTQGLLDDVCNYTAEEEEAPSLGGAAPGPLSPGARAMLANFAKLLGFWAEVYHSLSCERKFLEFSSGVPFPKWQALVGSLRAAIQVKLGEGGDRSRAPSAAAVAAEAPAPRECADAGVCGAGCACDASFGLSLGRVGLCA